MRARATTLVDVHRDADTSDRDGYEDETETAGTPVYQGIPFSIIEQTRRSPDPTTGDLVPVSALVGRCGAEFDVRKGDRVQDQSDGAWYAVADVTHPQSPVGVLDKRLELTRTSNATPAAWEPVLYIHADPTDPDVVLIGGSAVSLDPDDSDVLVIEAP